MNHESESNETKNEKDCCSPNKKNKKESKGIMQGIMYGLLPHTGCIAFILFTILGVTTATAFFKPLLMNRYFFYILMLLSFVFATISAAIYLKQRDMLSSDGIKKKWKYLSVMYGTTIGVNLLLFLVIFPLTANMAAATDIGNTATEQLSTITLKVDIPCPGHSPLISEELKTLPGVSSIQFRFPNYFDVSYDSSKTTKEQIVGLSIFNEYKAEVVDENNFLEASAPGNTVQQQNSKKTGCSCGGCSGSGSGTCSVKV